MALNVTPSRPDAVDAGNCDDLILFLNGSGGDEPINWDLNTGTNTNRPAGAQQQLQQQPPTPLNSSEDINMSDEYQERWLLADDFARQELGLSANNQAL